MPIKRYRSGSHPYYSYKKRPAIITKQKSWLALWVLSLILVLIVIGSALYAVFARPVDAIPANLSYKPLITPSKPQIAWPSASQAAVGSTSQGVLAIKPGEKSHPTASTAKLITVLTVLDHKPLKVGEQGPLITIKADDVMLFKHYVAVDGSVAEVSEGEKISQYQMIQGVLLPSANNYADTLAIWAFGSLENYQKAAQKYVEKIGTLNTTIGDDASGFLPSTVSTASDLTRIGIEAFQNPVMKEVMSQKTTNLPVAGVKENTNWLLGSDGVVGGKTGNTDEAGGAFVFASEYEIDDKNKVVIVGAVLGEPTGYQAIEESKKLIIQVKPHFMKRTIAQKGQVVASYKSGWGKNSKAVIAHDISEVEWIGKTHAPKVKLNSVVAPSAEKQVVGKITVGSRQSKVELQQAIQAPGWQYKLFGSRT